MPELICIAVSAMNLMTILSATSTTVLVVASEYLAATCSYCQVMSSAWFLRSVSLSSSGRSAGTASGSTAWMPATRKFCTRSSSWPTYSRIHSTEGSSMSGRVSTIGTPSTFSTVVDHT